ncbi:putative tail fibers protein [Escherichia phage vB_EcoM_IME392]|nr:putative tail fibers protein [Escherichia phage vB_EcoM_IME392]
MGGYIGFNPSDGAGELRNELTPKIKNNQDNIIELWANDLADCGYNLAATFEFGGILSNRFDLVVSLDRQRAYSWKGNFPVDIANAPITHSNWVPWSIDQMGAGNLLEVKWVSSRKLLGSPLWGGFVAADGGIFSRILYPDTWAAVNAGLVQVCPEADWVADPTKRHCYTTGDGTTTFRVPDLNGAYRHPSDSSKNSIPGLFLRGDNGSDYGYVQRNAAPNITGIIQGRTSGTYGRLFSQSTINSGALQTSDENGGEFATGTVTASTPSDRMSKLLFDASKSLTPGAEAYGRAEPNGAPADEVRPNSAVGCYAIRLQGRVVNPGTVDLLSLVDTVAGMTIGNTPSSNQIPNMKHWTRGGSGRAWWRKEPDGFIRQGGFFTANVRPGSGTKVYVDVTWAIPFPNECNSVTVGDAGFGDGNMWGATNITRTGARLWCSAVGEGGYYLAEGY